MDALTKCVRILKGIVLAVLISIASASGIRAESVSFAADAQSSTGEQAAKISRTETAVAPSAKASVLGAHSVKLSWKASVPATKKPVDAVLGYMVFRGSKPHDRYAQPINEIRVDDTTYTDSQVQPGKRYCYVTRAVSAAGLSAASNEVCVKIPR